MIAIERSRRALVLVLSAFLHASSIHATPPIEIGTDIGLDAQFGPATSLARRRYLASWDAKGAFFQDALTIEAGQDLEFEALVLDSTATLRACVTELPPDDLRAALLDGLDGIDARLDAIESLPVPVDVSELETLLGEIRTVWDGDILEPLEIDSSLPDSIRGDLLHRAGELRRHYDDLRYVAGRFRLYSRPGFQTAAAARLRDAALAIGEGRRDRAAAALVDLLAHTDAEHGTGIQEDAADRARSRLDRMLRRLRTIGATSGGTALLEASFAGVEIEAVALLDSSRFEAPSANVRRYGIGLHAEVAGDRWELAGAYEWEDRAYADRIQANLDRVRQDLSFTIAWDADRFDATFGPSWQLDVHPRRIDAAFEPDRADEVGDGLTALRDRVGEAGLPADLSVALIGALDDALGRLAAADLYDAVDCVEDFIDDVRAGRWDGTIDPPIAEAWIATAERLLPRRWRLKTKLPFTGTFDLDDAEVRVKAAQEIDQYPAHPTLDRTVRITEVRVIRWIGAVKITSELARRTTDYPPRPYLSSDRWTGSLDVDAQAGELETTVSWSDQHTAYLDPAKDRRVRRQSFALGAPFLGADVSFSYGTDQTGYPNDPGRGSTSGTDTRIGATWDLDAGRLSISLRVQEDRDDTSTLERTTRDLAVSWSPIALRDLALDVSIDWRHQAHPDSPEDDSRRLRLRLSAAW